MSQSVDCKEAADITGDGQGDSVRGPWRLPDQAATEALGAALAGVLTPGLSIWLDGDLGAGKTTLVRALVRQLGHRGPVKSPTYTLVELYEISSLYLYHFDFYRFNDPSEFHDSGFDEYFRGAGVCLVEWPDKAAGCLPSPDLRVALAVVPEGGREARLLAGTERGRACLNQLIFPPVVSS